MNLPFVLYKGLHLKKAISAGSPISHIRSSDVDGSGQVDDVDRIYSVGRRQYNEVLSWS